MEQRKLLIADGTEEFSLALTEILSEVYQVRTCSDGRETMELLRSFRPDLLVLDLMLPGLDGITIMERAAREEILPLTLVTTRFLSEYVSASVRKFGVDYMLLKPCEISAAVDRIMDLDKQVALPAPVWPDPRSQVTNVLFSLNIASNLDGYRYLREAVLIMAQNPGQSITKELYPSVAQKCNCDASHVERSSRNAIKKAWKKRNEQVWRVYFQPEPDGTLKCPSNSHFINQILENIHIPPEPQP